MFTFLKRSPRQPASRSRQDVRLVLESLERRDCPTAPSVSLTAVLTNSGRNLQLSGMVMDENPATVNITFSGVASGTTTPNMMGMFSYTTQASGLGTIYAVGVDQENLSSAQASATITNSAPTVSLTITYGTQRNVTVSGTVTDEAAGGLTVSFSGVVTGSAQTNSSGSFSFTAQATGLGTIQASTQDVWGQASNTAQVTVTSSAPVISNFQPIEYMNNLWEFRGQVTDESAAGLTVTFGGIPELVGQTATVQSTGWFSIEVTLAPGRTGLASAETMDWWSLASNVAEQSVSN